MDVSGETVGGVIAIIEVFFIVIMLVIVELKSMFRKKITRKAAKQLELT